MSDIVRRMRQPFRQARRSSRRDQRGESRGGTSRCRCSRAIRRVRRGTRTGAATDGVPADGRLGPGGGPAPDGAGAGLPALGSDRARQPGGLRSQGVGQHLVVVVAPQVARRGTDGPAARRGRTGRIRRRRPARRGPRRASAAATQTARGRRTPVPRRPDRGTGRRAARHLRRHGEEPDVEGAGTSARRCGTDRLWHAGRHGRRVTMAFTTEERALRTALDEVTLGQPEAPVDRAGAVRRRHVRRRQLQSVAAMAAVAVVAAGAVVVGGGIGGANKTESLNRPVPSWAVQWDDHRDGSVPQQVLTGAVNSWANTQRAQAPLPASQPIAMQPVVWYVGQRVPGTDQVLAVFEVSGLHAGALNLTKSPRLVVARAEWDLVRLTTEKGSLEWTFDDIAAPPRDYAGFIGSYLRIPAGDDGIHNVVWLLTSPSYRRAQTSVGVRDLRNGFVTFDAGQLDTRVEVSMQDEQGRYPAGGYVGMPGVPSSQVPALIPAPVVTGVPQGRLTLGESSEQGSSTYTDEDADAPAGRATTIYARCYSAGPSKSIRVSVDSDTDRALAHGVRIACDDRQHVVPGNPTRSLYGTGGHSVSVRASALVAWTVAVVISDH